MHIQFRFISAKLLDCMEMMPPMSLFEDETGVKLIIITLWKHTWGTGVPHCWFSVCHFVTSQDITNCLRDFSKKSFLHKTVCDSSCHDVALGFLTQNTMETKTVHRCSLSTTRDRKGTIQGNVTLKYKVTRQGYSVGLYCIESPDRKNHGNKKQFIVVAVYNQR